MDPCHPWRGRQPPVAQGSFCNFIFPNLQTSPWWGTWCMGGGGRSPPQRATGGPIAPPKGRQGLAPPSPPGDRFLPSI